MQPQKPRSNMWYLLPIFVGLIGGIIAYWVLRHDDPAKAKNCLYIGIVLAAIGIFVDVMILTQIPEIEPGFNVHV